MLYLQTMQLQLLYVCNREQLALAVENRRITINFHRTVQKPINVSHTVMKIAISFVVV